MAKVPKEISEYFKKVGAMGGKIGGKRSLETMTPEERSARAKKAVSARKWHPVKPAAKKRVAPPKLRQG